LAFSRHTEQPTNKTAYLLHNRKLKMLILLLFCVVVTAKFVVCRDSNIYYRPLAIRRFLDVLVVSMGGVASTRLMGQLAKCNISVNDQYDRDGLKHASKPPLSTRIARALFVTGDPIHALESLFAREYQSTQAWKLSQGKCVIPQKTTLQQYLEQGVDALQFKSQLELWMSSNRSLAYDVMFVRYPDFFAFTATICAFLRLPLSCLDEIRWLPTEERRNSSARKSRTALSHDTLLLFQAMYGDLSDFISRLPAVFVKPCAPRQL
jgi:hypothetical protein